MILVILIIVVTRKELIVLVDYTYKDNFPNILILCIEQISNNTLFNRNELIVSND